MGRIGLTALSLAPTHLSVGGACCIGRKFDQMAKRLAPRGRTRSRFWGVKTHPPLFSPRGGVARLVGPWDCRRRFLMVFLSVRPQISLLLGLSPQTIAVNRRPAIASSRCEPVGARGRHRNRRHHGAHLLFTESWEWGLHEETHKVLGLTSCHFHRTPLIVRDRRFIHSLGGKSRPTLPHREAKVSGVGSP